MPSSPAISSAISTSRLQPGIEIVAGEDGASFPTAYSSFAISLDSRDAAGRASMDKAARQAASDTASSTAVGSSSILKSHGKSRSSSPYDLASSSAGSTAKARSSPRLGSRHGVRFSISEDDREGNKWRAYNAKVAHGYPQHHRRSSTAAFLEYIKTHLPESRHRPPLTLTVKRAFLLFCIVFSATYLAMSLLQLFSGNAGYGKDVVLVRRGAAYYGDSDIFRGGNNLRNPHAAGDEHSQYVTASVRLGGATPNGQKDARAAAQQEDLARVRANKAAEQSMLGFQVSPEHDRALGAGRPNRKLRSATLAEQALLEEERRMAGKPVTGALPALEHVEHLEPYLPTGADASDAADAAAAWPADKRKPAMPFNRLNDPRTKLTRESRPKQRLPAEREASVQGAGAGAQEAQTAADAMPAPGTLPASATADDGVAIKIEAKKAAVMEGGVLSREEEEDLEAEIEELREKSLSRKLTRSRAARLSSDMDGNSVEESQQLPLDRPARQAPIVDVRVSSEALAEAAGQPAPAQGKKRPGAKLALMVKKRPSLFDGSNAPSSEKQLQQQERKKIEIERAALLSE